MTFLKHSCCWFGDVVIILKQPNCYNFQDSLIDVKYWQSKSFKLIHNLFAFTPKKEVGSIFWWRFFWKRFHINYYKDQVCTWSTAEWNLHKEPFNKRKTLWHFLNYSEHLKPSIRPWSANQCSSIERIGSKKKSFWTNKKFKLQTKFSPLRIKCSNDWSNYKIVYFQILFKRKNEEKSFSQSYFQFYFGFVKNCSQ